MAINKVKYGNTTLIDLTGTTATADKILTGYGAYGKDGVWMDGSATAGGGVESVTQDQNGYVILDDDEGTQIIVDPLSVTTNGTYTATTGHAYSPVTVNVPTGVTPTGTISITTNGTYNVTDYASAAVSVPSVSTSEPIVKMYDYDGTLLYSYTKTQFNNLTNMPSTPTHTGLTATGWNYSLADAKSAIEYLDSGEIDISPIYETSDGATHLFIELEEVDMLSPEVCLVFSVDAVDGYINWGDNSSNTQIVTANETVKYSHTYTNSGSYDIKIVSNSNVTIGYYVDGNDFGGLLSMPDGFTAGLANWNSTILKKAYLGSHVTEIQRAFSGDNYLESIMIPNSVTTIAQSQAFTRLYNLKAIVIPGSISIIPATCFNGCYGIELVILSPGITSAGSTAINSNSKIKHITIPSTMNSFPSSGSWMASDNTVTDVTILGGASKIPNYICRSFAKLVNLSIPSNANNIGTYAFYGCSSLQSVTLSNQVKTIGNYAFGSCTSLNTVSLSTAITSFGAYSFDGCSVLKTVTNFPSITSVPNYCFRNCYALASVELPSTVTGIGSYAFYNCYKLDITLPTGLKTIGAFGLSGAYRISQLPSSLTSIDSTGCQGLRTIRELTIPSGVTTINSTSFSGLNAMIRLTIHSNVTTIAASAFANGYCLKEIHLQRTTPPTLSAVNAFNNLPSDCIIYVPKSDNHTVLDAYQAATNWSTYASQMQEEPS